MNPKMLSEYLTFSEAVIAKCEDESRLRGRALIAYADELGINAEVSVSLALKRRPLSNCSNSSPEIEALMSEALSNFEKADLIDKDAKRHLTCPICNHRRNQIGGSSRYRIDEGVLCHQCAETYYADDSHELGVEASERVTIGKLPAWDGSVRLGEYLKICRHGHSNYLEVLAELLNEDEDGAGIHNLQDLAYILAIRESVDLDILSMLSATMEFDCP